MRNLAIPRLILPAFLILLACSLSFREIRDMDIGFHLKAGHWIINNLRFPVGDVFSYAAYGLEYIDLYWFYQVVLAVAENLGGPLAIVLEHAFLIGLSVALVLWRHYRQGSTPGLLFGVTVLCGVHAMSYHFGIRPHVFSWVYLNLILLTLEEYDRNNSRPLWPLGVIMLFWVNSHTLFVLGGVAVVCFGIGALWEKRRVDAKFLFWSVAALAVCFLNPYGYKGVLLPFKQFLFLQSGSAFKDVIDEYKSPFHPGTFPEYTVDNSIVLFQPIFFFHGLIAVAILAVLVRCAWIPLLNRLHHRRRIPLSPATPPPPAVRPFVRVHEILLVVLFTYVMLSGFKNIGFFVMACLPIFLRYLDFSVGNPLTPRRTLAVLNAGMVLLTLIACLRIATNAYYTAWHSRDRVGYVYSDNNIGMRAMRWLNDNGVRGTVFNHINFGGMLMHFTDRIVYLDARNELIGEALIRDYLLLNSREGKMAALEKYKPDFVIFPSKRFTHWHDLFYNKNPDWRLVFVDDSAEIYLRKGYMEHLPRVTRPLPLTGYPKRDPEEIGALMAARKDRAGFAGLWRELTSWQEYPTAELDIASWLIRRGFYDDTIQAAAQALAVTTRDLPSPYHYLGLAFFKTKDYARARDAFKRFLEKGANAKFVELVKVIDEAFKNATPAPSQ